jgi:copper(I)-binding protein
MRVNGVLGFSLALVIGVGCSGARGQDKIQVKISPVSVSGAWARATAPGQMDGVAYMTLASAAGDRLTGAVSPDAGMAMLHSTTQQGGMSGMQDVDGLDLPAGQEVALAPHGLHLMLMGLKHPLVAGEKLELELDFAKAGKMHVTVPVQPLGASGPPG